MTTITYPVSNFNKEENDALISLFTQTFSDSEGETEGKNIGALVNDLLTTTPEQELKGFVAKDGSQIIGAILFTPLRFEHGEMAYLLSPVATLTDYQGKGVAQSLINSGLSALKKEGITLAFTYGDPNFYGKVGFEQVTEDKFKAPHALSFPHGWLAQSLVGENLKTISGESRCAKGLDNPAYW